MVIASLASGVALWQRQRINFFAVPSSEIDIWLRVARQCQALKLGGPAMRTPEKVAEQLIAEAPDAAWLRAVVDGLDRQVRTVPLDRLQRLWGLSASETARMFGVSRQAFSKWHKHGIPSDRANGLSDLSAATDILDHYVKRERIPAVVRRRASKLNGRSLYDLACAGSHTEVRAMVAEMFDLRRVQP